MSIDVEPIRLRLSALREQWQDFDPDGREDVEQPLRIIAGYHQTAVSLADVIQHLDSGEREPR